MATRTGETNDHDWQNLARLAQSGDQQAYRQLLEEISPRILSFVSARVSSLGNAEDLLQTTLIAIHSKLHTYDPAKKFSSWMYAIARYKSIDCLRERQRKWKNEVEFDENLVTIDVPAANNIENEAVESIHQALEQLPEKMRRAVELTKLQGLSTEEAATKEGISAQALRTRVSRAYDILRRKLEKEFG